MPVIGFLSATSPETNADRLRAFRQGLKETGYVEGENVTIEYRWAENQIDRLPALAADLVRRQVAVIAATGDAPARWRPRRQPRRFPSSSSSAKTRSSSVLSPASLGQAATSPVSIFLLGELVAKRLELLRELVPGAVALPCSSTRPVLRLPKRRCRAWKQLRAAMGLQIQVLNASTSREIDAAFATLARERPDALFVGPTLPFHSRRVQLATLAARHAIPATFSLREYAEAGGLMSYGANLTDAFRQVGVYTGRILKGAKPADLPVVQATKFELVINS